MAPQKASRPATELVNEPRRSAWRQSREAKANLSGNQARRVRIRVSDSLAPHWHSSAAFAHHRLLAHGYFVPAPRRPSPADIEKMLAELPYGLWTCADGRIVIFNRRYHPLWHRLPDGTVERANSYEWVKFIEQRWFDYTDVRYARITRERLCQILRDLFAGKDLTAHTIVTEWDFDRPEVRP